LQSGYLREANAELGRAIETVKIFYNNTIAKNTVISLWMLTAHS